MIHSTRPIGGIGDRLKWANGAGARRRIRAQLLSEQNHVCGLCGTHILPDDEALDHNHETGLCRSVVHKKCNRKIHDSTVENVPFRISRGQAQLAAAKALVVALQAEVAKAEKTVSVIEERVEVAQQVERYLWQFDAVYMGDVSF